MSNKEQVKKYKRRQLITFTIRTLIAVAIYVAFWEYKWLRWTLLFYVPLSILGLFAILGNGVFFNKDTEQKITNDNNTISTTEEQSQRFSTND